MKNNESTTERAHPLVLFDGVCNFCAANVQFIIKRDPPGLFRFASLQSPIGQDKLQRFDLPANELSTMVLIEGDRCFTRSTAALKIARRLKFPWSLLSAFFIIPKPLRDGVYNWIARNRYRWFGKKEACMVPTPEIRGRFLG